MPAPVGQPRGLVVDHDRGPHPLVRAALCQVITRCPIWAVQIGSDGSGQRGPLGKMSCARFHGRELTDVGRDMTNPLMWFLWPRLCLREQFPQRSGRPRRVRDGTHGHCARAGKRGREGHQRVRHYPANAGRFGVERVGNERGVASSVRQQWRIGSTTMVSSSGWRERHLGFGRRAQAMSAA